MHPESYFSSLGCIPDFLHASQYTNIPIRDAQHNKNRIKLINNHGIIGEMICFAKIATNCSHFLNSRYNITADEGNVNTQSHYKIVIAQKSPGNIDFQCSQDCILIVVYSTLPSMEQVLSLDILPYHP